MKIKLGQISNEPQEINIKGLGKISIQYDIKTNELIIEDSSDVTLNLLRKIHSYPNKEAFLFDLIKETTPIIETVISKRNLPNVSGLTNTEFQNLVKRGKRMEKKFKNSQIIMKDFPWEINEKVMEEYRQLSTEKLKNVYYGGSMNEKEEKYISKKIFGWEKTYDL